MAKEQISIGDYRIYVIDTTRLSSEVDAEIKAEALKAGDSQFAPKIASDETLYISKFAIAISKSGKRFVTDNECVHSEITGGKVTSDVYSQTPNTHSMFPRFTSDSDVDKLLKEYSTESDLKSFMGSRFKYNPRIESNMRIFTRSMSE